MKKVVDKWATAWYSSQAVAMKGKRLERSKQHKIKFENLWKTYWQMKNFVLIYKSSLRTTKTKWTVLYLVNWITQRRTKNTLDNWFKDCLRIGFLRNRILSQRKFLSNIARSELFKNLILRLRSWDTIFWEFDPGSGRTLAACLTHASRTG